MITLNPLVLSQEDGGGGGGEVENILKVSFTVLY